MACYIVCIPLARIRVCVFGTLLIISIRPLHAYVSECVCVCVLLRVVAVQWMHWNGTQVMYALYEHTHIAHTKTPVVSTTRQRRAKRMATVHGSIIPHSCSLPLQWSSAVAVQTALPSLEHTHTHTQPRIYSRAGERKQHTHTDRQPCKRIHAEETHYSFYDGRSYVFVPLIFPPTPVRVRTVRTACALVFFGLV